MTPKLIRALANKTRTRRKQSTSWIHLQSPSLQLYQYKKRPSLITSPNRRHLLLFTPVCLVLLVTLLLLPVPLVQLPSLHHTPALILRKTPFLTVKMTNLEFDNTQSQYEHLFGSELHLTLMILVRKVN